MSELINTSARSKQVLWQLMSTASALVLMGATAALHAAKAAEDEGRPTVWIELGGQLQHLSTSEEAYAPSFLFATPRPRPQTISPLDVVHLPRHSVDGEGAIKIQPENSTWSISAAIRYGRSQAHQHAHQQSYPTKPLWQPINGQLPVYAHAFQFIDAKRDTHESHSVVDFQVGKDVGLGMFGAGGSSTFNFGVRFAQFNTRSTTAFRSDPDAHQSIHTFYFGPGITIPYLTNEQYHVHAGTAVVSRNFHGLGPSLSWKASAPVMGSSHEGQLALDWGLNAALLFGRQKADTHHQSSTLYHRGKYGQYFPPHVTHTNNPPARHRARSVTVPNIGAFAGVTYRLENFRISAGYRADFFLNAMDGGIDTHRSENESFYGPFATISVGLGG